jgi:hypothetical protein
MVAVTAEENPRIPVPYSSRMTWSASGPRSSGTLAHVRAPPLVWTSAQTPKNPPGLRPGLGKGKREKYQGIISRAQRKPTKSTP